MCSPNRWGTPQNKSCPPKIDRVLSTTAVGAHVSTVDVINASLNLIRLRTLSWIIVCISPERVPKNGIVRSQKYVMCFPKKSTLQKINRALPKCTNVPKKVLPCYPNLFHSARPVMGTTPGTAITNMSWELRRARLCLQLQSAYNYVKG